MERPMTTKNIGQPCVICGQAADAQATIAALQARLMTLKHHAGLDCGDNSCLYAENKTGMRTNGGCRCSPKRMKDDLERSRKACDNLQAQLTQRTAELEAANKLLYRKNCALGRAETIINDLQAELERVRALIKALPKGEGDWTVSCALADRVVEGGIVSDISEAVAAIVQHRQGMEG